MSEKKTHRESILEWDILYLSKVIWEEYLPDNEIGTDEGMEKARLIAKILIQIELLSKIEDSEQIKIQQKALHTIESEFQK